MPYGYTVISQCNVITIIARDGLGEDINGGNNLFVVLTPAGDFLATENDDIIDTENGSSIEIEP